MGDDQRPKDMFKQQTNVPLNQYENMSDRWQGKQILSKDVMFRGLYHAVLEGIDMGYHLLPDLKDVITLEC